MGAWGVGDERTWHAAQPGFRGRRLLLVDDAASAAYCWRSHLQDTGIELEVCTSFAGARARIEPAAWSARPSEYAIVDMRLTDGCGEDLLPLLAALEPPVAVAVVSGFLARADVIRLASKCVLAVERDLSRDEAHELLRRLDEHWLLLDPFDGFARLHALPEHEKLALSSKAGVVRELLSFMTRAVRFRSREFLTARR